MKSLSNKVKILILVGTFALAMCGSVIYGYLNTSDIAVNEFTSGNVNISITESAWNAETAKDPEYAKHLYPEETITKDPAITNTGTEDAYVFMKVTLPYDYVTVVNENEESDNSAGTSVELDSRNLNRTWNQIYQFTAKNGWYQMGQPTISNNATTGIGTISYLFAYGSSTQMTALSAGKTTGTLFDSVTLINLLEGQFDDNTSNPTYTGDGKETSNDKKEYNVQQDIEIDAFAIQADWLTDGTNNGVDSGTASPTTVWNMLKKDIAAGE